MIYSCFIICFIVININETGNKNINLHYLQVTSNDPGSVLNPNADEFEVKSEPDLDTDSVWELPPHENSCAIDGRFINLFKFSISFFLNLAHYF